MKESTRIGAPGKPRLDSEALERQRRPQQVAGESLEAVGIVGPHGDRIVGRKARVARLPGVEQLDPLLGQLLGRKRWPTTGDAMAWTYNLLGDPALPLH